MHSIDEALPAMIATKTVKFIIRERSLFACFDLERLSQYYTDNKGEQKNFISLIKRQLKERSADKVPKILSKLKEPDMQGKKVIFDVDLFLQEASVVNMAPFTGLSNFVYVPLVVNLNNQESISIDL
jgi:hypothetical protein